MKTVDHVHHWLDQILSQPTEIIASKSLVAAIVLMMPNWIDGIKAGLQILSLAGSLMVSIVTIVVLIKKNFSKPKKKKGVE